MAPHSEVLLLLLPHWPSSPLWASGSTSSLLPFPGHSALLLMWALPLGHWGMKRRITQQTVAVSPDHALILEPRSEALGPGRRRSLPYPRRGQKGRDLQMVNRARLSPGNSQSICTCDSGTEPCRQAGCRLSVRRGKGPWPVHRACGRQRRDSLGKRTDPSRRGPSGGALCPHWPDSSTGKGVASAVRAQGQRVKKPCPCSGQYWSPWLPGSWL